MIFLAGILVVVMVCCGAVPLPFLALGAALMVIDGMGLAVALSGTDAPGGYTASASNEQLAVHRYLSDPDAEVADLDRDLDRVMRGKGGPATWDDCPDVNDHELRTLLAASRANAPYVRPSADPEFNDYWRGRADSGAGNLLP